MKQVFTVLLAILFLNSAFAQEEKKADVKAKAKTEKPAKEKKIKATSKGPKVKPPYRFMANIHGGIGLMNYFGDLRDKSGTTVHRVGTQAGYNFGIGANVTNYLEVNIDAKISRLGWEQNVINHDTPRNFRSNNFSIGANLVYNFQNLILSPTGITPFVSIGIGYTDFDVYTDRFDKDGNQYYYWDDNLIRNVSETSADQDEVTEIFRDYEYETKVTENSPIITWNLPVGLGFDFNANRNIALRVGAWYYFTGSDKIDDVEGGNTPVISNDGYIYTAMSLYYKFDPFKKKAPKVETPEMGYEGIAAIVDEDSDGDGVNDLADKCGGTPKGLVVDENGCPADGDGDGIPDYRDKELKTTAGRVVDENGVAISYQDIYKTYGKDTISLKRSSVNKDWLYSQKAADSDYTVHVGTYTNYDIPTQIKLRLAKMTDLVEHKVNDSISVFTVGTYESYEEAEKRQKELLAEGIDEAFGVNDDYIPEVGEDLGVIGFEEGKNKQPKGISLDFEDVDVLQFGVEIREYRLRIELDKLSKLMAQHGVEMKTTEGGLKIYTIGAFNTFEEAEALQRKVDALGVKNSSVSAKLNAKSIDLEEAKQKQAEMQESQQGE